MRLVRTAEQIITMFGTMWQQRLTFAVIGILLVVVVSIFLMFNSHRNVTNFRKQIARELRMEVQKRKLRQQFRNIKQQMRTQLRILYQQIRSPYRNMKQRFYRFQEQIQAYVEQLEQDIRDILRPYYDAIKYEVEEGSINTIYHYLILTKRIECAICGDKDFVHKFVQLKQCGHRTCEQCIKLSIRAEVDQGSIAFQCPHDDTCPPIKLDELESIIEGDTQLEDIVEQAFIREGLRKIGSTFECPSIGCKNVVFYNSADFFQPTKKNKAPNPNGDRNFTIPSLPPPPGNKNRKPSKKKMRLSISQVLLDSSDEWLLKSSTFNKRHTEERNLNARKTTLTRTSRVKTNRVDIRNYRVEKGQPDMRQFKCRECKHSYCILCSRIWQQDLVNHHGVSCDAYRKLRENAGLIQPTFHLEDSYGVRDLMSKKLVQPCPHCKTPIMKNGGCPSMYCTACQKNFTWDTTPANQNIT